jgi:hypothetical protein
MKVTSSYASLLFTNTSSSATDTLLSLSLNRSGSTTQSTQSDPVAVLKDAEKNSAKQIAAKASEPQIKREVEAFVKGVVKAKTVDELLADPNVTKVLLATNGLEEFAGYKGLVSKALKSDPDDENSVAVKLASTNAAWLNTAKTLQFATKGLSVVKAKDTITEIASGYAEVRWRESLDAKAPGVSAVLSFKEIAKTLTSPYNILGSGVAREVVTVALGLPAQIAYQPLRSQATALTNRLDIKKLQDPAFVDALAKRYLINLNNSSSGVSA